MTDLNAVPWTHDDQPTMSGAKGLRRRNPNPDPANVRRGRNNRARGNRAELAVARRYGGEKTGPLGQPEDIRGKDFRSQVKSHQRPIPSEWRKAFALLDTQSDGRIPRLVLRFTQPGVPAADFVVFRAADFVDWFGRDE